jgi:hypothetical protein
MAFLPQRHRSTPPQIWEHIETHHDLAHLDAMHWRPVRRGPSFTVSLLLTVVAAAAFGWMVRSTIERPQATFPVAVDGSIERSSAAQPPAYTAPPPPGPCADAETRIVRNGPRPGGFATRDVFGFLPSCEGRR